MDQIVHQVGVHAGQQRLVGVVAVGAEGHLAHQVIAQRVHAVAFYTTFFTSGSLEGRCEQGTSTATTVHCWWWTRTLHTHTCVLHNFNGPLFLMTNFQNRSEQDTLQSLCLQLAFGPQLTLTSPLSTINSKSLLPLAMQFSMPHLEL